MTAKQTQKSSPLKKAHRHLRLAVVPHAANQYRPHLVRRYGLVAIVSLVLCLQFLPGNFAGGVLGERAPVSIQELLARTNEARKERLQPPLVLNPALAQAAELKAQDMISSHYWAHTSPSGVTPWTWFKQVGYQYAAAGENLAKGFYAADAVVAAWMASPEHRANVLGAYTEVGFAVIDGQLDGSKTRIIVAHYGRPAGATTGAVTEIAPSQPLGPISQLGVTIRTLPPSVLGSLAVLIVAAGVAAVAHVYRSRLPRKLRTTLYRHHGIAKAGGLLGIAVVIVLFQSGGQI